MAPAAAGRGGGDVGAEASALPCVQASEIKWASRWDTYLTMSDVQIHWFSIVNSVVVVFFLSGQPQAAGASSCCF